MLLQKPLIVITLLSSVFLAGCQEEASNVYGYEFETAKITYQISGSSVGTSETLLKGDKKYIHNQITQTRPNGEILEMDNIFIQDGSKLYALDGQAKTGTKIATTFYQELQGLSDAERAAKIVADAIRDTRSPEEQAAGALEPEGVETIAGQKCELYKSTNLETCIWQGIRLRTVASLPEYAVQTTTIATNIELNQPIPDSVFEVPQDYQISELN